ncbi:hypothetical protein CSKR_200263 [Clonorchis sinensis]|uniref:Uncharacterized protein n=1 Tax=Clonorchis sinensis TaxID=79923 RepID=A0A8T1M0B8_CLOSI|nr:hypothetical protein CSKR_200263 [Clonorchis sinensis]
MLRSNRISSKMHRFVTVCLTVLLLMAYSEARPETDSKKKLRESGAKLMETVRSAMLKIYEKCKQRLTDYMERDNLGEKLAEVMEIFMKRLKKRIEDYTDD